MPKKEEKKDVKDKNVSENVSDVKDNVLEEKDVPKVKDIVKDKIEVDKNALQAILDKITDLEASREEDKETISALTFAADKSRLAHFNEKKNDKGQLIRTAGLGVWEYKDKDHLIMGWKMLQNEVYVESGTGKVIENQIMRLFLIPADAEQHPDNFVEVDIPYGSFQKSRRITLCNIVSKTHDEVADKLMYTLEHEDGRKFTIDVSFVNP